ncbi:MAG: putative Ig domain-containing protein, partial [Gammaproteobacteria bacterium]|nr:putative Ig domain-containing protein [Gammaproteobacteria bacterium]
TTTPVVLTPIAEDSGVRLITQAELLANANDDDGDSLTAASLAINSGSGTLLDNGDGTWNYTPALNDDSGVSFSYTISDGVAAPIATSASLDITPVNDAPTVMNLIPDQIATEDMVFSFQFAPGTFNDVDTSDNLTYTAQQSDGSALPVWLVFDGPTRTFTGVPTNADVGSLTIEVTATDDSDNSVIDTFALTVSNTNDAPIITSTEITTATENSAYSYTLAVNDVDPSDTLTLSAPTLPSWLSFDPATGVLSGTPGDAEVGDHNVILRVNDGAVDVDQNFTISVSNINNAPTLINPISDQTATEDVAFSFQFASGTFNDVDSGDNLKYTAMQGDGSALPNWLRFDGATHTFSGNPLNADVGTLSIEVTATDDSGMSVSDHFNITVSNVNDAPILGNNQMILTAGDRVTLTTAILSASDLDNASTGLLFTVTDVTGGQFELAASPGTEITNFTQAQVSNGEVVFVDDGDEIAPTYRVSVSDGSITYGPRSATIVFNPDTSLGTVEIDQSSLLDSLLGQIENPEDFEGSTDVKENEETVTKEVEEEIIEEEGAVEEALEETSLTDETNISSESQGVIKDNDSRFVRELNANNLQALLRNLALRPTLTELIAATDLGLADSLDLTSLAAEIRSVLTSSAFNEDLDRVRDDLSKSTLLQRAVVGSGAAVTTSLSVGYVAWLIRGGVLMSTMLSSLPAWQIVDPLPVLARTRNQGLDLDDDDDSLESMIEHQSDSADEHNQEAASADEADKIKEKTKG